MNKKFLLSVLYHSSIIFTVLSILATLLFTVLFWGIEGTQLPSIGVNFALLLISYISAILLSLLLFKLKKPYITEKINVIYLSATIFTYFFLAVNLSTVQFKNIWCEGTIFAILAVSILTSVIKYLLKIPYFAKIILNFVLFAIPYFLVSVLLGNFGEGNKMMILIFVYLLLFAIVTTIISVIKIVISKHKNETTSYSKMFK